MSVSVASAIRFYVVPSSNVTVDALANFVQSPSSNTLQVPSPFPTRSRSIPRARPPRLGIQTDLPPRQRGRSASPSSTSPPLSHMPSFSLVGALEFRRVVSSLQRDASYASLARFGSPLTPYAYRGSRHHQHSRSRTPLRTPGGGYAEEDPWDTALGLSLDQRRSPAPADGGGPLPVPAEPADNRPGPS